jgi:hypothetical protein
VSWLNIQLYNTLRIDVSAVLFPFPINNLCIDTNKHDKQKNTTILQRRQRSNMLGYAYDLLVRLIRLLGVPWEEEVCAGYKCENDSTESCERPVSLSVSLSDKVAVASASPSASASHDDKGKVVGHDGASFDASPYMIAAAFLPIFALLAFGIWHQTRSLERNIAAASKSTHVKEPRMFMSQRASRSLRMSRLDKSGKDTGDGENQRDRRDSRRLSAYSNARRKSEVAQEDAVNRDIDAAVWKKKEKRRQTKPSARSSSSSQVDNARATHAHCSQS